MTDSIPEWVRLLLQYGPGIVAWGTALIAGWKLICKPLRRLADTVGQMLGASQRIESRLGHLDDCIDRVRTVTLQHHNDNTQRLGAMENGLDVLIKRVTAIEQRSAERRRADYG